MANIVSVKRQSVRFSRQALETSYAEYGSFEQLERLLQSLEFRGLKVCRIEQAGEQMLVLKQRGAQVAFTCIHLEKDTGRFYHIYQTQLSEGPCRDNRYYFAGAHDVARFLEFVIRRAH